MIRALDPAEWPAWRDLRLRALADAPHAFVQTLAEAAALPDARWIESTTRPDRRLLVAESDGRWHGMAVVVVKAWQASIYAMWVAPEARRLGVGRALVDAAVAWAGEQGAGVVELGVTPGNREAEGLYRAGGFAPSGGTRADSDAWERWLRPLVMGVVNVTPDSFSDGGRHATADAAIAHAEQLLRDGADIVDVGGEATNPKATPIDADTELARVLPVVVALGARATVSIDTTKAAVARAALAAGAAIVNDVSGGLFDPDMPAAVGDAIYVAGHLRGRTLSEVFAAEAAEGPTWRIVADELAARVSAFSGRVWVDPGIGFGKGADPRTNLALLRHAGDLRTALQRPVVVGPSRKRFLRRLVADADLDIGSVAACLAAVHAGANVVRIHNVALLRPALTVYTKI